MGIFASVFTQLVVVVWILPYVSEVTAGRFRLITTERALA